MKIKEINLEEYKQKLATSGNLNSSEIKSFVSAGCGYWVRENVGLKPEDFRKGINVILPNDFYSISQSFWELLFDPFIENYNSLKEFHERVKFSG